MKIKLLFLLFIASLFAQQDTASTENDSLSAWMKMNPIVSVEPKVVKVEELSIDEKTFAYIPIVFFAPQSFEIKEHYKPMLDNLIKSLDKNPDVNIVLKGYYSKFIDDILAPVDCLEMANNRIDAVRSSMLSGNPTMDDRILIEDSYDRSCTFFDDTTDFDMRVTIDYGIERYRTRSILLQDQSPYLRISYRDIIKSIHPVIDSLLLRNPDIYVQIHANGNPWDAPLHESYFRLKRAKDFLEKKLSPKVANRITMQISPNKKKPKNIDIRLVYAPLGTDLAYKEIISKPEATIETQILLGWNHEIPIENHSIQYLAAQSNQLRHVSFGEGSPADTLAYSPKETKMAFLPGSNKIFLSMTDLKGNYEISEPAEFDLQVLQYTYRSDMIASIFGNNQINQFNDNDCTLYRISQKIISLSETSDKMMNITVQSHANSDYIDSLTTPEELIGARSSHIWDQISSMIIGELELKNLDGLKKWFEKKSVEVFIEPAVVDDIEIDEQITLNSSLLTNKTHITIELTSE